METRPLGKTLRYLRQIATPPDGGQLDAELIERFVTAHDQTAFAHLVDRHGPLVLGVCRRVLHNHHDAEDVFQATFLVLARKARHIRQRHALAGWLYKVAYHLSVKLRAAGDRQRQVERQPALAREKSAEDESSWGDLRTVLDEELARLPEKYRTPLLLCCLAGRTRDEAAEQLGWTLGTLKMRLERGRQLLRTRLARRGLAVSAALLAQHATASPVPAMLATTTLNAAMLFAAGETCASLSARTVGLANLELSAGAGKARLVGAAVLLLTLLGVAGGLLVVSRSPESSDARREATATRTPTPPALNRFIDATEATGLSAILSRHYQRFPGWCPSGATLLDIDGDGQLDLHLAGQAEGLAALGRNTGGRFVGVDPRPAIPRGPRHHAEIPYPGGQIRHAFDFNEDRKLDLAISWHNNGGTLYHNATTSDALRFRRVEFVQPEFPDIRTSALADVDRDGRVDFLISDPGTDIAIHLGTDDAFHPDPNAVIPAGLHWAGAIPVDLDGDGQLELIARQTEHHVTARRKIFRNTGPLKWSDATRQAGLSEAGSVHGVGDLNQDGYPDLICMEGEQLVIYLNNGKGWFTRKPDAVHGLARAACGPHSEWGDRWGGAVVTDFDNDGVPDILINARFFLYLLRGLGDGSFEYTNDRWGLPDFAHCDVDDGLCFGDVDGDGRLDLVLSTGHQDDERRPVGLFLNRVSNHHWLRVQLVGKPGNASATGAKVRLYEAGNPGRLLAYEQVSVWGRQSFHSYYAARQTERHFGLGQRLTVDVSVEFYPSGRRLERKNVPADQTVVIAEHGP